MGRGKAWKETPAQPERPQGPQQRRRGSRERRGSPGRTCGAVLPKKMCPRLSLESGKGTLFGKASLQTFKFRILM